MPYCLKNVQRKITLQVFFTKLSVNLQPICCYVWLFSAQHRWKKKWSTFVKFVVICSYHQQCQCLYLGRLISPSPVDITKDDHWSLDCLITCSSMITSYWHYLWNDLVTNVMYWPHKYFEVISEYSHKLTSVIRSSLILELYTIFILKTYVCVVDIF